MGTRKIFSQLFILLCLFLVISTSFAEEQIQLQLHLERGQVFNIKTTIQSDIAQTVNKSEQKINQTVGVDYRYEVTGIDPEQVATVKVTYIAVRLRRNTPAGVIEYDSANPPTTIPDAAKGVAIVIGESFFLKLNRKGSVVDVQGVDDMINETIQKMGVTAQNSAMVKKAMKEQICAQSLKESFQQLMVGLNDVLIGTGDSWKQTVKISKGFPMIVDNNYTLREIRNGMAFIHVYSTIKPNPDGEPLLFGDRQLSYRITGQQQGNIQLQIWCGG